MKATMEKPSTEQLEQWERDHPRTRVLSFEDDTIFVVVRSPTSMEYRRWKDAIRVDQQRAMAGENLARACLLYPSAEAMSGLLVAMPALYDSIAGEVLELAGMSPAKKVQ